LKEGKQILWLLNKLGVCEHSDNVSDEIAEEFWFKVSLDVYVDCYRELLELTGADIMAVNPSDEPEKNWKHIGFRFLRKGKGGASESVFSRKPALGPAKTRPRRPKQKRGGD